MVVLLYAAVRSLMNVPFTIPSSPELEKEFISQAAKNGMVRAACHEHAWPQLALVTWIAVPWAFADPAQGPSQCRRHARQHL